MTITSDHSNVRWGPNLTDLFDVALHPTRDAGGNPLLIYRHHGGGETGGKASGFDGSFGELEDLFPYLLSASRSVHFDIATVETEQAVFDGVDMVRGRSVHFPENIMSAQRAIAGVRLAMRPYGTDPSNTFVMGGSHGSWTWMMAMLMHQHLADEGPVTEHRRRFDARGLGHPVRGGILWQMPYPDWRRLCASDGLTFSGATINGTSVTKTSGFSTYRYVTGDQCYLTGGAGVTAGLYTIASKTSNNAIVLATSASSGTATSSGYVSTDQTDLLWSKMLFRTKSPGNDGNSVPIYAEWDALPDTLKDTVSPQAWAENYDLSYLPPLYFITNTYTGTSAGTHPAGPLVDLGGIHDQHWTQRLSDTLVAAHADSTFEQYADLTDWASNVIPRRLYDWLVSAMAER